MFYLPLFINRGSYQAYESHDFFAHPGKASEKYQYSWVRYGDLPPFSTSERKTIMHAICRRVERYEDLPASIREYVETEVPLYKGPPKDLDEVRALQKPDENGSAVQ